MYAVGCATDLTQTLLLRLATLREAVKLHRSAVPMVHAALKATSCGAGGASLAPRKQQDKACCHLKYSERLLPRAIEQGAKHYQKAQSSDGVCKMH